MIADDNTACIHSMNTPGKYFSLGQTKLCTSAWVQVLYYQPTVMTMLVSSYNWKIIGIKHYTVLKAIEQTSPTSTATNLTSIVAAHSD